MPIFSGRTFRQLVFEFPLKVDLQFENLVLRHQIGVLQRAVKKRPKLSSGDRLRWFLCPASGATLTLVIVKPEAIAAWRHGLRRATARSTTWEF